ncbi:MAG: hypothetical protein ACI3ZF_02265 [Candidatus Cryptobacteroides sp.]
MEDITLSYNSLGKEEISINPFWGHNADKSCSFMSTGEPYNHYFSLCEKHNDLSYPHMSSVVNGFNTSYTQCDFKSINIISNHDYDQEHPKGKSLNDIIRFMAFSPNPFIQSGYSNTYNYHGDNNISDTFREIMRLQFLESDPIFKNNSPYHPIDKFVDELTEDDMVLLGYKNPSPLCYLTFEKKPINITTHHIITIILTADEERTFSKSIEITFQP